MTLPTSCSDTRSRHPCSLDRVNISAGITGICMCKMRANLTLNLGVRYEYVSPLTEINNRLVNLDLSPGVLNPMLPLGTNPVTPITPGYGGLPDSLVRPDRNNFAPRIG